MTVLTCPHCGARVEAGLLGCPFCFGSLTAGGGGPILLGQGDDWIRTLQGCEVIGGYGYPIPLGRTMVVTVDPAGFHFGLDGEHPVTVALADVLDIEIGGPGRVSSGGGFIGGGFGLEGAATGMLVAGVLNALTTRTDVLTVVALLGTTGEVWFAHTKAEPAAVRVELAPAFVALRRLLSGRS